MGWAQVKIDLGSAFAVSFLSKTAPCWDADTLATRNIRHENPDECAAHLSRVLYCQRYASVMCPGKEGRWERICGFLFASKCTLLGCEQAG